jgi:protein TonB
LNVKSRFFSRYFLSLDSTVWVFVLAAHLLCVAYVLGYLGVWEQAPLRIATPSSPSVMVSGRLVDKVNRVDRPSPSQPMPALVPPTPAPPATPTRPATPNPTPTTPSQTAQALPAPTSVLPSPSSLTSPSATATATASPKNLPTQTASFSPPRTDAFALSNPLPIYPPLSRRQGEEGRVLLNVHILENGQVGEVTIRQSSGFSRLDEAALVAVRQWHYVPAKQNGVPLAYWYVQPLSFSLDPSESP